MKQITKVNLIDKYDIETLPTLGESRDDMEYSYSCAMADLTDNYSGIIKYWGKKMISEDNVFVSPDIKGYEEFPHVTLKYGIHSSKKDCLDDILSKYKSIKLDLGKVTKFENDDFDVIKIDASGDDLFGINKEISEKLECTDTFPDYKPHVTIAYVKKGSCDDLLDNDFFEGITDEIKSVTFSTKDGNEYDLPLGDK